jgi:hypothetical protein
MMDDGWMVVEVAGGGRALRGGAAARDAPQRESRKKEAAHPLRTLIAASKSADVAKYTKPKPRDRLVDRSSMTDACVAW